VAEGKRPVASEWAQAVKSDDVLVGGLMDPDEGYALGCAAAIIGTVMPPTPELAKSLRDKAVSIGKAAPDTETAKRNVQARWAEIRKSLIGQQLSAMAGKYSVTLRILPTAQTPKGDPSKLRPVKYDLGEVVMTPGDGGKITFSPTLNVTVSDHPLSLKINTPGDLGALPGAKDARLKERNELPSVAFDLVPDRKGRWSGSITLADQRTARLTLTAVK
jgi:hypothetical protein